MNPDNPNNNLSAQDPLNFDDDDDFLNAEDRLSIEDDNERKVSLADIWRNNPSLKIFAVVLVAGIFLITFLVFGGNEKADPSVVAGTSGVNQPPGTAQLPPAYEEAVRTASEQRATAAELTGGSALPTPIGVPERIEAPPAIENTDPLAEWRRAAEQRATERREQVNITAPPSIDPVSLGMPPTLQPQPQQLAIQQPVQQPQRPPLPTAPTDQQVSLMSQRFSEQIKTVLDAQIPNGFKVMAQSIPTGFEIAKDGTSIHNVTAAQQQPPANLVSQEPPKIIIPAGTIAYAQTLLEANSDVPGPVLAELASGPLSGARLLGSFQLNDEYLSLKFSRAIYKGKEYAIEAYAIDPATTLPALATDVNHHYFSRILIPAAARFLQGYAQAVSQRGSTVVVNNSSTTLAQEPLDGREQAIYGTAEALNQVAQVTQASRNKPITVKVASGTRMGLLFMSAVSETPNNGAVPASNPIMGSPATQLPPDVPPGTILVPGQAQQQQPAVSSTTNTSFNQNPNRLNNNGLSTIMPVMPNSTIR